MKQTSNSNPFSVEALSVIRAYKIQQNDLARWDKVLKAEIAQKLREWAESTNDVALYGYQVRRGQDLYEYLVNVLMNQP